MFDCIKSMGRSLREIWPLSLCRRKPVHFADIETGLQHSFGDTEVVLSPAVFANAVEFNEVTHKTGELHTGLHSHRSHATHRTVNDYTITDFYLNFSKKVHKKPSMETCLIVWKRTVPCAKTHRLLFALKSLRFGFY